MQFNQWDNEDGRVNQALQKNSDVKNLNILYNLVNSVVNLKLKIQ